MNFCVTYKINGDKQIFKSIADIARQLNVSYAVCYKNFKYSQDKDLPKGIKIAQRTFDDKYEINIADN
jgi:hypothetical protein